MDPLGLDPICCWARFENRDPIIGAVCGEVARATMSAMAC